MNTSTRLLLSIATLGVLLTACGTDDYIDPILVEYTPESSVTSPKADILDSSDADPLRPRIELARDGTVLVGERRYPSIEEFQTSPEFLEDGHRCGSVQTFTPSTFSLSGNPSDCSFNFTSIQSAYQAEVLVEIPVVFHIIQRSNGVGFIPESRILSQIEVLNEDFQALAGTPGEDGIDARIRFVLAQTDPDGNPSSGINYYTNNQWFNDPGPGRFNPMMNALAWDPNRYLNIYTNDSDGALGYASFPQQSAGQTQDGVVLLHSSVGRNAPNGGIYNQGRTATHELGHYFGLFHTFQDGCGNSNNPFGSGDRIADTPQHPSPDNSCQPRQSQCGTGLTPVENYMNYSPDSCMYEFSPQQINRMRCSIINYRPDLYTIVDGSNSSSPQSQPEAQPEAQPVPESQPPSSEPTVLTNGQFLSNLSGNAGSTRYYQIEVPSSANDLYIAIDDGSGDADLYVRRGSLPTESSYDCRPYKSGNDEECSFQDPQSGTWYIMIRGYSPYQGASLLAEFTQPQAAPAPQPPAPAPQPPPAAPETITVDNLSASTGQQLSYFIDIPAGLSTLTIKTSGGSGDADLYVRQGAAPTTSVWDYRPYNFGNDETVNITAPEAGRWHIMINAYETFNGLVLSVTME